jgi:hypothetical protein
VPFGGSVEIDKVGSEFRKSSQSARPIGYAHEGQGYQVTEVTEVTMDSKVLNEEQSRSLVNWSSLTLSYPFLTAFPAIPPVQLD